MTPAASSRESYYFVDMTLSWPTNDTPLSFFLPLIEVVTVFTRTQAEQLTRHRSDWTKSSTFSSEYKSITPLCYRLMTTDGPNVPNKTMLRWSGNGEGCRRTEGQPTGCEVEYKTDGVKEGLLI